MTAATQPVSAHSVAETYLYLLATPCPICGGGPSKAEGDLTKTDAARAIWRLAARCDRCRKLTTIEFSIKPEPTREAAQSRCINPTSEPSRAIDLPGWLNLFQSILAAAEKESDRPAARQLTEEAAACLDEALKFYEADNDVPPETAFFSEAARRRFRDHPRHFARGPWLQRRLMLPRAAARTTPGNAPIRRWWQFWR